MEAVPRPPRARLSAPAPRLFLGLTLAETRLQTARIAIIPAPFDQTTSYRPGTRLGPDAILEASRQVELYDEELDCEPCRIGIATLREVEVEPADIGRSLARLEALVGQVAGRGMIPFTLGGEHSLTIAPVRALTERYPGLCVLQLDAHLDLRAQYQETPHSHASVMRRVRELGVATVAVGVRSVSLEEAEYVHAERVPVFLCREIRARGLPIEEILGKLTNPVYVTIDLDAFDPAFVPGVGTPEPGGLTWDEGCRLLRAVCERRQVVGLDLVELCPIPGQPGSDFFAAKLTNKLVGYLGLPAAPNRRAARRRVDSGRRG
jgi:agmatinase